MKNLFLYGDIRLSKLISETFLDYRKVAERSSGALALSVVQVLVMIGCLAKRDVLPNLIYYWGITGIALLATIGFCTSILSIGAVIIEVTPEKSWRRQILFWLFYPVVTGVFLVAAATLKSL